MNYISWIVRGLFILLLCVLLVVISVQTCRINRLKMNHTTLLNNEKSYTKTRIENEKKYYKEKEKILIARKKAEKLKQEGEYEKIHKPFVNAIIDYYKLSE